MKIHLSIEADSVQEYQDALASLMFISPTANGITVRSASLDGASPYLTYNAPNEKLIDGFLNRGEAPEPTPDTEKVISPAVPAKKKPVKPVEPPKEKPTTAPAVEPVADPAPEEPPVKKAAVIDIDSLRELAYPLNTGGDKTKAALKGLLADYGAKALGELSVDDYPNLQAAMLELHKQFGITI